MQSNVRSVLLAIAYALIGAVVLGGGGVVIGFWLAPDDGLQAVFNAAVGGAVGAVLGGMLGIAVSVAGTKAMQTEGEAQGPRG